MGAPTRHADRVVDAPDPGRRRLLIVDDHAVIQAGYRALLSREPWVERCLTTDNGDEAVRLSERYEVQLALVDLFIGQESGVELCRRLTKLRPDLRVLLMSGHGKVSPVVARSAGAIGFMSKTWPARLVVQGVKMAAAGKIVYERGDSPPRFANLTARERDVLELIAAGASNPEAAQTLNLSPHTVKQYTSSLYKKLGARNRAEAVLQAQRMGLVH